MSKQMLKNYKVIKIEDNTKLRRPAVAVCALFVKAVRTKRGFPSAPLLTRVASQNLAVGRRFPSSWGLHFLRASSKEHPSGRFNSQFERRPFGASSYHISSVLVPCRFSDVPMRTGSPYLAELLDAMLVVYCVVA
ncbi:hypothetical protein T02_7814 [Trichinella nativa]|uniref:Uncharacterized protein n=1 Tax=Trichinella nativa TaxID=6335 RepID=A0A0V1LMP8_9BILA|nr:hypothetical protein T02_7814 [Trichinella nativa]